MPKAKKPYGDDSKHNHRPGLFDRQAVANEQTIEQHMRSQINVADPSVAKVLGLNGIGFNRSQIVEYAIREWSQALERGERDELEDILRWAQDYTRAAYIESDDAKKVVRVYMSRETHDHATRIFEYLDHYPGLDIKFLRASNGSISWRVIFWLALERMAYKIRQ